VGGILAVYRPPVIGHQFGFLLLFKDRKSPLQAGALFVGVLSFGYLTTGRTYFLLFFALHLFPLLLTKQIGLRGILVGGCALVSVFVLVATMPGKGVYTERDLYGNLSSLMVNMRSYTIAPLLAFSTMFENPPQPMWGANTFRSVLAILHAIGFSDVAPPALIREWVNVPDATNAYTVYDPYFRDFGGFGFIILMLAVGLHVYLYRRAVTQRGVYLFLYGASAYR
jgi:oligosaccharide repeat unit polymerase